MALYQGTAQAQELPHTQQRMEHVKAAKVLETLAKAAFAPGQSVDLHCRRGWLAAAYDQVCLARQEPQAGLTHLSSSGVPALHTM